MPDGKNGSEALPLCLVGAMFLFLKDKQSWVHLGAECSELLLERCRAHVYGQLWVFEENQPGALFAHWSSGQVEYGE